jgi:hypothetical protein
MIFQLLIQHLYNIFFYFIVSQSNNGAIFPSYMNKYNYNKIKKLNLNTFIINTPENIVHSKVQYK